MSVLDEVKIPPELDSPGLKGSAETTAVPTRSRLRNFIFEDGCKLLERPPRSFVV